MADIFISYSKADRELADKLATLLEAEGWTVWWDKSLSAGDAFRDEIMKEIAIARAVIVIWTKSSIGSDWVRAEAGRGKAEGKLIPVKTAELTYEQIPLPFGEMHTENVTAHALIRAAVVGQLAKPQVAPSAFRMATKTIRLQILTWFGIVGGAMTIFANLRGIVTLADWARWVVAYWQNWTHAFWSAVLGWTGIRVSTEFVPSLSFVAFVTMVIVGTTLKRSLEQGPAADKIPPAKVKRFLKWSASYTAYLIVVMIAIGTVASIGTIASIGTVMADLDNIMEFVWSDAGRVVAATIVGWILAAIVVPLAAIIYLSDQRLQTAAMISYLLLFAGVLVFVPTGAVFWESQVQSMPHDELVLLLISLCPLCAIAIATLAPVRLVNQRLLFLALGAILLVALNQISALDLHRFVDGPKG